MIIQAPAKQGAAQARFMMRMIEHTTLAGRFARVFGNSQFEPVQPREVMLYMIDNHDRGWMDFDASPDIDPATGLPWNLIETPAERIVGTSAGSPDFNERHHPYAGLLSSMHSWGLYNGRYGLSDMVLIDTIGPQDRPLADRMLAAELERQARLRTRLLADPATAHWVDEATILQNYKQLQFFDTLALYFNRAPEGDRTEAVFPHVPMARDRDATIVVRPVAEATYALSPFPFEQSGLQFEFEGRWVEPVSDAGVADWVARVARAPVARQAFTLLAD